MTLKLGPLADDKPVKVTIDMPANVYRDLTTYADAHAAVTNQVSQGPAKLITPMIAQFMKAIENSPNSSARLTAEAHPDESGRLWRSATGRVWRTVRE